MSLQYYCGVSNINISFVLIMLSASIWLRWKVQNDKLPYRLPTENHRLAWFHMLIFHLIAYTTHASVFVFFFLDSAKFFSVRNLFVFFYFFSSPAHFSLLSFLFCVECVCVCFVLLSPGHFLYHSQPLNSK